MASRRGSGDVPPAVIVAVKPAADAAAVPQRIVAEPDSVAASPVATAFPVAQETVTFCAMLAWLPAAVADPVEQLIVAV